MANRHERRRAAKSGDVVKMSLEEWEAIPTACAWAGCTATTATADAAKNGWSCLILHCDEPKLNFEEIDPRLMARDCVLFAQHARYLDETLLKDISGRLRNVEGSA